MAFVVHFSPFDGRRVSSPNPKKKNLPCDPKTMGQLHVSIQTISEVEHKIIFK